MQTVEKTIEVEAPISSVYNQWTQFEEFPRFMEGVREVRQISDTRLHWRAEIAGKEKEWDAGIFEQVPDRVIAWRSTAGEENAGAVHFEPLPNGGTRIRLSMSYDPKGVVEKVGDALGVVSLRVQGDLNRFKEFLESRGSETGAWRGNVEGGEVRGR
jgi:uncharacterized membrane protein